jgi:ferredoxin
MIVAERKPMEEILAMIEAFDRILVLGCKSCTAVCGAGGSKEVEALSTLIREDRKEKGKAVETLEASTGLQCDPKSVRPVLEKRANQYDVVLSMACGAGVQTVVKLFPDLRVLPALNTNFIGMAEERGVWSEVCVACGDCILGKTEGICPMTRCAKQLLNGPCGGSMNGKCEISKDVDCAWQLIIDRLTRMNRLEMLEEVVPIKDWSAGWHGGPQKIVREDLKS